MRKNIKPFLRGLHKQFFFKNEIQKLTPMELETATHSSILAWKIPWTEEPEGLQSMGSQRVRQDWATNVIRSQLT